MVSFVILHYVAYDATINCIESIRKCCKDSDYNIVIVDNASPNDSGEKIEEYVKCSKDCVFLTAESNLGFANGNNLGYKYAKEHFNPDYMFVMNNDTVLQTENIESILEKIHSETNFDILGPDVYTPNGEHHNPTSLEDTWNREETIALINRFNRLLRWYFFFYFKHIFSKILNRLRSKSKKRRENFVKDINIGRKRNAHLMGACYILSRSFIEQEENVFDPRTFIYVEEVIFTYTNRKKNREIIYDDAIKVLHMHAAATKKSSRNIYKRVKSKFKNMVHSLNVYLQVIEEYEGKNNNKEK